MPPLQVKILYLSLFVKLRYQPFHVLGGEERAACGEVFA